MGFGEKIVWSSEKKPLPKAWQQKGYTDGEVSVDVILKDGKYEVMAKGKSAQDDTGENEPSYIVGALPDMIICDSESEAKDKAKELIDNSDNWEA